jgi:rhomboid protease GluP
MTTLKRLPRRSAGAKAGRSAVAKAGRRGTFGLALVMIAVFLIELWLGAAGSERALVPLGALRTRGWSAGDSWRILTFSFLHFNTLHLALNTAGLLWLGGIVERRLGPTRFAGIFAGGAVASGIAGMLLGPLLPTTGVAIGASGAICGLLAGALVLAVRGRGGDRRLLTPLLICLIVVIVLSLVPGVSLAGHIGGFAGGALIASILA